MGFQASQAKSLGIKSEKLNSPGTNLHELWIPCTCETSVAHGEEKSIPNHGLGRPLVTGHLKGYHKVATLIPNLPLSLPRSPGIKTSALAEP